MGQLGIECAKLLRGKYGEDSVILSDIIKPSRKLSQGGPYIFADILDFKVSIWRSNREEWFWEFNNFGRSHGHSFGSLVQHARKKSSRLTRQKKLTMYDFIFYLFWLCIVGFAKNRCRSSHRLDYPLFGAFECNRRTKCPVSCKVRFRIFTTVEMVKHVNEYTKNRWKRCDIKYSGVELRRI